MKEIGGFIARLSSRKFLLTIGGIFAVTLYPEGATPIVALISTFVGAEGIGDAVSRYAVESTKREQARTDALKADTLDDYPTIESAVDTSQIVAGGNAPY